MNKQSVIILSYVLIFLLQVVSDCFLDTGLYVHICLLPLVIIALPYKWKPGVVMPVAFALGLLADILSGGVLGVNAGASLVASSIRNPAYRYLISTDGQLPAQIPSSVLLHMGPYLRYLSVVVILYLAAYILLDAPARGTASFFIARLAASAGASIAACYALNLLLSRN